MIILIILAIIIAALIGCVRLIGRGLESDMRGY